MKDFRQKNSGIINSTDFYKPSVKLLYWILFIILLIVAFICVAPPLWIISSSMKDIKEFYAIPPTFIPKSFHPEKLLEVWKMLNFGIYYLNTVLVLAGALVCAVFFNGIVGYVISKLKPRGSKIVYILILWSMMLPSSVTLITVFKNIVDVPIIHINLTNTFIPLWLMVGCNSFYIILYKSFFDNLPEELTDAGIIDGCGPFTLFSRIIVPLSKPVIMVTLILTTSNVWADFLWPYLILRDESKQTVIVKIYNMMVNTGGTAAFSQDKGVVALTFAILPIGIFFMIFQKHIINGFTFSGIKG